MKKKAKPTIWDIDLGNHLGYWIVSINCPYCEDWYQAIVRCYHKGSGPADLVHEVGTEKHILEVVDIRAEHWFKMEIETKRKDNGEPIIFRGNLTGTFYR